MSGVWLAMFFALHVLSEAAAPNRKLGVNNLPWKNFNTPVQASKPNSRPRVEGHDEPKPPATGHADGAGHDLGNPGLNGTAPHIDFVRSVRRKRCISEADSKSDNQTTCYSAERGYVARVYVAHFDAELPTCYFPDSSSTFEKQIYFVCGGWYVYCNRHRHKEIRWCDKGLKPVLNMETRKVKCMPHPYRCGDNADVTRWKKDASGKMIFDISEDVFEAVEKRVYSLKAESDIITVRAAKQIGGKVEEKLLDLKKNIDHAWNNITAMSKLSTIRRFSTL